jgi:ABC-type transporter Mla MlaB component
MRRFDLAAGGVTSEVVRMSASNESPEARAAVKTEGDAMEVALAGTWQITAPRPSWDELRGTQTPKRVRLCTDGVAKWDSSLLLFLFEVQQWCRAAGAYFDSDALPEKIRTLLAQLAASHETSVPFDRSENFFTSVGLATQDVWVQAREISHFVGECVLSVVRLVRSPRKFRWGDCLEEMQQCGAMALPIVSLISFLVGVTLAYTGAIVLRLYGGDIFIADLIKGARHLGDIIGLTGVKKHLADVIKEGVAGADQPLRQRQVTGWLGNAIGLEVVPGPVVEGDPPDIGKSIIALIR